jgi:hypothetical protein
LTPSPNFKDFNLLPAIALPPTFEIRVSISDKFGTCHPIGHILDDSVVFFKFYVTVSIKRKNWM